MSEEKKSVAGVDECDGSEACAILQRMLAADEFTEANLEHLECR